MQWLTAAIALSGPTAVLLAIGRAIICIYRSARAKKPRSALFACLAILALLAILAGMLAVWFVYGVAHTGKDMASDLGVLAVTVTPAYVSLFGAWRLTRYLERRLGDLEQ